VAHFENREFKYAKEHVDGHTYSKCSFKNVEIVHSGGEPPSFVNCTFSPVSFNFEGAAGRTVSFLKALSSPGSGFQDLVRKTSPALSSTDHRR
jgi:hypothetical protein